MFTHRLSNDDELLVVEFAPYAERHFLKDFQKKYPARQWQLTEASILQDLSRLKTSASDLQFTQQVDELWYQADGRWIFKYDFRVAGTPHSAKASGNRCVAFLDLCLRRILILAIYHKHHLPGRIAEHAYIRRLLQTEFPEIWQHFTC